LFADCLLLGLAIALTAVPIVTAYPGFVAACSFPFSLRGYWARLREAVRSGVGGMLVPPAAAGLLALDAVAIGSGLPGSAVLGPLVVVAGVILTVLGMRAAGRWRPGAKWGVVVRAAWHDLVEDVRGSLLLGLAVIAAAAVAVGSRVEEAS
jgi:hypothetical protein